MNDPRIPAVSAHPIFQKSLIDETREDNQVFEMQASRKMKVDG